MRILLCFLLLIVIVGCSTAPSLPRRQVNNVERVFMHTENHYSVAIRQNGELQQMSIYVDNIDNRAVKFVDDVPTGQPMWLEYDDNKYNGSRSPLIIRPKGIIFHITTVADINGAGWNKGKFGRGQTVVIQ